MNTSSNTTVKNKSMASWFLRLFDEKLRGWLSNTKFEKLGFIFFCIFLAGLFAINVIKPEFNWDMAAYLASSLQDSSLSNQALHSQVWGMMKAHAGDAQYYKLTAGNAYNLFNFQNPDAFISMLPMYDVKVGYVGLLKYVGQLVGPVNAAHWISVLSSLVVGLICLTWMKQQRFLQAAPMVAAVMLLSGYFYMGRIVTPDLLVTMFFLLGSYFFLRGKDWLAVVLFYGAFLVRPDTILFMFALFLATLVFNKRIVPALIGFLAAVASYLWITTGSNHPGWWAHFYFSCVEIQNTMIGFHPDFSLLTYFKGVARGVMVSFKDNNWPMLVGLMLMGWALMQKNGIATNLRSNILILAILLCIAGKFVVFPLPDDRTFMPFLLVFAMILFETWKPQFLKETV